LSSILVFLRFDQFVNHCPCAFPFFDQPVVGFGADIGYAVVTAPRTRLFVTPVGRNASRLLEPSERWVARGFLELSFASRSLLQRLLYCVSVVVPAHQPREDDSVCVTSYQV